MLLVCLIGQQNHNPHNQNAQGDQGHQQLENITDFCHRHDRCDHHTQEREHKRGDGHAVMVRGARKRGCHFIARKRVEQAGCRIQRGVRARKRGDQNHEVGNICRIRNAQFREHHHEGRLAEVFAGLRRLLPGH